MDFNNQTITLEGRRIIAQALSRGSDITYTHLSVGDGVAPAAPEELTCLANELFTIPISAVYEDTTTPGAYVVSTAFSPGGEKGDFWLREVGVYAKIEGGELGEGAQEPEPVLIAYLNAGDTADYIHAASDASHTQIELAVSVVLGTMQVSIVNDPNAAITRKDIDDLRKYVQDELDQFEDGNLNELKDSIKEATSAAKNAADELKEAKGGYVSKNGDTMQGDLTMEGTAVVRGDLEGSAAQWRTWRRALTLGELGLAADTFSPIELHSKLSDSMELHAYIEGGGNNHLPPEPSGILEARRFNAGIGGSATVIMFTALSGIAYVGSVNKSVFSGWRMTTTFAPGMGSVFYGGGAIPLGWLECQGQALKKADYAALYAAIGDIYGSDAETFNLPDTRGFFLRGLDSGRGVDADRKLGSSQQSGAPNINGHAAYFAPGYSNILNPSGAFYLGGAIWCTVGGGGGAMGSSLDFKASRSSSVYKDGLKEVRPPNIAVRYLIKY